MSRVTCPNCNKPLEWSDASPWKPFCSERCKLIDLGAWFKEAHKIAGDESVDDHMTDSDNKN